MLTLSVLDQSPIRSGRTPADAIQETLQLAAAADRLGYRRYWLAEHHSSEGLAGSAPEILIGQVAARTSHIRVGSGGVMLSHYSALKVAENFRVLETLFPGRIDLGIGRAPGSDRRTAMALAHGPGALGIEQFPAQIRDVIHWLHDKVEDGHPFASVRAMPVGPSAPEVWLLGLVGGQRDLRGPLRHGVLVRPLHQRQRRRRDHADVPGTTSSPRSGCRSRRSASASS